MPKKGGYPMTRSTLFSERIRHYCIQREISYYHLSYRSTVPMGTLMHILDGSTRNPRIHTLLKICSGLDIDIKEFFDCDAFENIELDAE